MIDLQYQTVNTSNGVVGYTTLGSGEPMILVVGYSGTMFHWNSDFVNELAKHHTLYLIDNRNIGLSQSNNADSMHGLADDVSDFIDALKINKPWVLGWSMGGAITLELACKTQDKLRGLILMAAVPSNYYVNMDFIMFMANAHNYTKDEFRKKLYYFFFSKEMNLNEADYIKSNALNFANYNYRFTDKAKDFQDAIIITWGGVDEEVLSQITMPVLMLWSENDFEVSKEAQEFILKNIPHGSLVEYNNGGHFLIHHDPLKVAKDTIHFCKSSSLNNEILKS